MAHVACRLVQRATIGSPTVGATGPCENSSSQRLGPAHDDLSGFTRSWATTPANERQRVAVLAVEGHVADVHHREGRVRGVAAADRTRADLQHPAFRDGGFSQVEVGGWHVLATQGPERGQVFITHRGAVVVEEPVLRRRAQRALQLVQPEQDLARGVRHEDAAAVLDDDEAFLHRLEHGTEEPCPAHSASPAPRPAGGSRCHARPG